MVARVKGKITKGRGETFDCGDGFMGVYMCENVRNFKVHFKCVPFVVCQLYLHTVAFIKKKKKTTHTHTYTHKDSER